MTNNFAPINSRLNVVRSPIQSNLVEMAVGLAEVPRYPELSSSQNIFLQSRPVNDRGRPPCTLSKIDDLFFVYCFLSLFSLPYRSSFTSDDRQWSFKSWSYLLLFCACWQYRLKGEGQCNAAPVLNGYIQGAPSSLPRNLTPFSALTPGAILSVSCRLLLGLPSPPTLCHLLWGPQHVYLRYAQQSTQTPLCQCNSIPLSSLAYLLPSIFPVTNPTFCFFPTLLHFRLLFHAPWFLFLFLLARGSPMEHRSIRANSVELLHFHV